MVMNGPDSSDIRQEGGRFLLRAELLHQRHVEAAIGVVHRRHDGQRRKSGEEAAVDAALGNEVGGDHGDDGGGENLHRNQHAALARHRRRRLQADAGAREKNHTDRIGSVPVIVPFVNEPKNLPVFGAKVFKQTPSNSGTIIMPPGIFSMPPLMFTTGSFTRGRLCFSAETGPLPEIPASQ
jgi:hypothetical protein